MNTRETAAEFQVQLSTLLSLIKSKAETQFKYNIETNVPSKILRLSDCVENAIHHSLVSTFSEVNDWDILASLDLAADLLEDVNAHSEAKRLRDRRESEAAVS